MSGIGLGSRIEQSKLLMGSALSISCLKSLILASGGRSGKGGVGFMNHLSSLSFSLPLKVDAILGVM